MRSVKEYHDKAMDLTELALVARLRGDSEGALPIFEQALEAEVAAIESMDEYVEPTFSILHRSAGTLALDCNQLRRAEKLAATALAKDPPPKIAAELRDLLERVHFQRHLEQRGIALAENEMQMSLSGPGVSFGVVGADEFSNRIGDSSRLITRIAERQAGRPFREGGSPPKSISEGSQLFVSVPRAASFAVTLRFSGIGAEGQQSRLPFKTAEVVDEFMDLMEFVNDIKAVDIQKKISDPAYLRYFLRLAKKIAPDGERIRQVGFTLVRDGTERMVSVTRPAWESPLPLEEPISPEREFIEVRGTLRFADATRDDVRMISVIDSNRKRHFVEVPEEMMNGIVRPLWGKVVTISGWRKGKVIEFQDIQPSEAD